MFVVSERGMRRPYFSSLRLASTSGIITSTILQVLERPGKHTGSAGSGSGKLAISHAAIASCRPPNGTMPEAINRAANTSGRFSGNVATSPTLPPVWALASASAVMVHIQSSGSQRSARGKSTTSKVIAKSGSITLANVAVIAAKSPQM